MNEEKKRSPLAAVGIALDASVEMTLSKGHISPTSASRGRISLFTQRCF
ncbi:unnamed protein product [Ectocarpus sp. 12 AP-2014]